MNEWIVIAVLFGLAVLAAGLGTLCDRLDVRAGGRSSAPHGSKS